MYTGKKSRSTGTRLIGRTAFIVIAGMATLSLGWAAQDPTRSELPAETPDPIPTESQISQAFRSSVKKVVVIAGQIPTSQSVAGSYEKETAGLIDGMEAGWGMGTITKEIAGIPVSIPIPGLAIPGAIFGALSGATKREIQEFRDELTEQIAQAESPPLRSDGLALDVFWGIRRLPHVESQLLGPAVEIPADADAALYVSLDNLTIDVQGSDAIITTSATAILRRLSDGMNVYEILVEYQDRDTLSNWTKNENALWRDYTNFARYYLGRQISADLFDTVIVSHELWPTISDTVEQDRKNERKFTSSVLAPTLAWELTFNGDNSQNSWTDTIDKSEIFFDVEVFDDHHLVYYEENISDPLHTLAIDLEACQTYRWSVRPSYHIDGEIKFGEWMRFSPETDTQSESVKGLSGKKASVASAYTQDFAHLEIECKRR